MVRVGAYFEAELARLRQRWDAAAAPGVARRYVVTVEDFLRNFSGKSSQGTIFTIGQINGMVCYACSKVFAPAAAPDAAGGEDTRREGAEDLRATFDPSAIYAPSSVHPTAVRTFFNVKLRGKGKATKPRVLCEALNRMQPAGAHAAAGGGNQLAGLSPEELDEIKSRRAAEVARNHGVRIPVASAVWDAADAFLVCSFAYYNHVLGRLLEEEALRMRFLEAYWAAYEPKLNPKGELRLSDLVAACAEEAAAAPDDGAIPAGALRGRVSRLDAQYEKAVTQWFRRFVALEPPPDDG
mmetsp:Transcript_39676/g.123982  ORF Transcript_39676/g.123982 Transcript_39676/m.123982 type:complete len:296 (-) Transcript_39676:50-937(-)